MAGQDDPAAVEHLPDHVLLVLAEDRRVMLPRGRNAFQVAAVKKLVITVSGHRAAVIERAANTAGDIAVQVPGIEQPGAEFVGGGKLQQVPESVQLQGIVIIVLKRDAMPDAQSPKPS